MVRMYILVALTLLLATAPTIADAQSQPDCNGLQDVEICITDVSQSKTNIENGETITITVTVQNVGNETGDAVLITGTEQPNETYNYALSREIQTVEPGEVQEVDISGAVWSEGNLGQHRLNFMLFDTSQQHLYDATGYYTTLVIHERTSDFDLLSWLKGLNLSIKIIIGLLTLSAVFFGGRAI